MILEKLAILLAVFIGCLIPMIGIGCGVIIHKIAGYVAERLLNFIEKEYDE